MPQQSNVLSLISLNITVNGSDVICKSGTGHSLTGGGCGGARKKGAS